MITLDDLTPQGAALFNEVNAAVATLPVEQAIALRQPARALDVVLCDEVTRARYASSRALAEVSERTRTPRRAALRLIHGGRNDQAGNASGQRTKPAKRPFQAVRTMPTQPTPPEVA